MEIPGVDEPITQNDLENTILNDKQLDQLAYSNLPKGFNNIG